MTFIIIGIFLLYIISAIILPYPNWTSYGVCLKSIIAERNLTIRQRLSMLRYLLRDLALLPFWMLFWMLDELIYSNYHKEKIHNPIFIISQPRSGTTFLLRTLSEDNNNFLSIKHLEWRYPYISFWKLISLLGIKDWLENKSYWPKTELGKTCAKIHPHVLGNFEEFGIFLEERFYHHYFVFRRFPFQDVIKRISKFNDLSEKEKNRMIDTFLKVVQKVYYYRGANEYFLAKENENVEFCKSVIERLTNARVLLICREPQPMLQSYKKMSVVCTQVKHGVNPTNRQNWDRVNMDFRLHQCQKFIKYWDDVSKTHKSVLISFEHFTKDVINTTLHIYNQFDIPLSTEFEEKLYQIQAKQDKRNRGYENLPCDDPRFNFYGQFVKNITSEVH